MGFACRMLWSLAAGEIWFSQGIGKDFCWDWMAMKQILVGGCLSLLGCRRWGSAVRQLLPLGDRSHLLMPSSPALGQPPGLGCPTTPHYQPKVILISPQTGLPMPSHPQALLDPHQASGPKMQLGFLLPGEGQSSHSSFGNNTSLLIFSSLLISESFK